MRNAGDARPKATMRLGKYAELKEMWETLNLKVILEYKFDKEAEFKSLFTEFLKAQKSNFTIDGVSERVAKVEIKDDRAIVNEVESIYGRNVATISTMKYSDFLKELSKILNINKQTLSNYESGQSIPGNHIWALIMLALDFHPTYRLLKQDISSNWSNNLDVLDHA